MRVAVGEMDGPPDSLEYGGGTFRSSFLASIHRYNRGGITVNRVGQLMAIHSKTAGCYCWYIILVLSLRLRASLSPDLLL